MQTSDIIFKRHRFPPQIIAHAVWLYLRFNLSLREVEEMLLERGIDVSYETVRRWIAKFGPQITRNLRRRQARPGDIWYLDEVVVKCAGEKFWLWRAVDQHGSVLEEILQKRRDKRAAKRLLVALMKRYGFAPKRIITDKLWTCTGCVPVMCSCYAAFFSNATGDFHPSVECLRRGL